MCVAEPQGNLVKIFHLKCGYGNNVYSKDNPQLNSNKMGYIYIIRNKLVYIGQTTWTCKSVGVHIRNVHAC
jgi:hypothetical protein